MVLGDAKCYWLIMLHGADFSCRCDEKSVGVIKSVGSMGLSRLYTARSNYGNVWAWGALGLSL